ncbi:hypothetical protein LTR37_007182 [Vermiconidia calcicola]|uniref:Uncharacterized protein n=1 Tax=Vermiconidia calcicola TaxID=1690605 RepID=A0ACC3NED6_9PEZI|nr:hypothetical protein LTR37_007182 [Vermiconidia calcicola]
MTEQSPDAMLDDCSDEDILKSWTCFTPSESGSQHNFAQRFLYCSCCNCSFYDVDALILHRSIILSWERMDSSHDENYNEPAPSVSDGIAYELAGRQSPSHTFRDMRSARRARRRLYTEKDKYFGFKGVKRGQLGREHYKPSSAPHVYGFPTPLPEAETAIMTKQMLYNDAQYYPKPPRYHYSHWWEKRCPWDCRRGVNPRWLHESAYDEAVNEEMCYFVTGIDATGDEFETMMGPLLNEPWYSDPWLMWVEPEAPPLSGRRDDSVPVRVRGRTQRARKREAMLVRHGGRSEEDWFPGDSLNRDTPDSSTTHASGTQHGEQAQSHEYGQNYDAASMASSYEAIGRASASSADDEEDWLLIPSQPLGEKDEWTMVHLANMRKSPSGSESEFGVTQYSETDDADSDWDVMLDA